MSPRQAEDPPTIGTHGPPRNAAWNLGASSVEVMIPPPDTSFDTGWVFLAIVSFAFALVGLAGRNPVQNPMATVGR